MPVRLLFPEYRVGLWSVLLLCAFGALLTLTNAPRASAADKAGPTVSELQDALNDLEICPEPVTPLCAASPKRSYTVHKAQCVGIAADQGRDSVACRIDETLTYQDPRYETSRYHDECVRFARRGIGTDEHPWVVLQIRDRTCEQPSMLTGDPNPLPRPAEIERAIIASLQCWDHDGITDCVAVPEKAKVIEANCAPIEPGTEFPVRVACRVTGEVRYANGRLYDRFENTCLHLDRTTPIDRSPARWVSLYIADRKHCTVN